MKAMERMRRDNPDVKHARGDQRGHALFELTPERMRCEFRATEHPVREQATYSTQATYVVEAGRPGVQAA